MSVTEAEEEYGIIPTGQPKSGIYDGIVLAVAHYQFKAMGVGAVRALGKQNHIVYDLKYLFPAQATDIRL